MRAHPSDGGVAAQHALLVYDDGGAVFARLPTKPASDEDAGVVHCRLGTIELPSDVPGSARFRRTMEARALELLGRAAGQELHWATEPTARRALDALHEIDEIGPDATQHEVSRRVRSFAGAARALARRWQANPAGSDGAVRLRQRWMTQSATRLLQCIDRLTRDDIVVVLAVLGALEASLGVPVEHIGRFRDAARLRRAAPIS